MTVECARLQIILHEFTILIQRTCKYYMESGLINPSPSAKYLPQKRNAFERERCTICLLLNVLD